MDKIGEERKSLKQNQEFSKRPGGAPANVAVAASRLGADVELVATVGEDEFGEFLLETVEEEGISTERIAQIEKENTTLAFASLDEKARPHFVFYRGADEHIHPGQLEFESPDILHVGSLPFTRPETAENILERLEGESARISFDPNLREDLMGDDYAAYLEKVIPHVDILTAAEEEIEFFGGLESLRDQVEEIIVTQGEEGAILYTEEGRFRAAATQVDVVDTTGAGDALTGAYLAFREKGSQAALEKAVKAASLSTTAKGAMSSLPRRSELE